METDRTPCVDLGPQPHRARVPAPNPAPGQSGKDHPVGTGIPNLIPRPVTRPWCDGQDAFFSWEVLYRDGSAFGVTDTKVRAMRAVTAALHEHDGRQGIVQKACLGAYRDDARDQYAYGRVVGQARLTNGRVEWTQP